MFAALIVPDFSLQAVLRHLPEARSQPVALIAEKKPKAPILECTAAARAEGVEPGLTTSQARARCPGVLIKALLRKGRAIRARGAARKRLQRVAFRGGHRAGHRHV